MNIPLLTEPGTKYFIKESLKICHTTKLKMNNTIVNLALFLGFSVLFSVFLIYKYQNKPNEEDKKKKKELKKTYLLTKIKEINDKHQEKYNKMITNLPKFESNFEMLHKKFYDV
jgi:hypothetical protein